MTTPLREAALANAREWQAMTSEIKTVIIERLDLPIPPEWLTDDQPLFGRGLELDSIDALELTMAIDQKFSKPVYEDDMSIFGSVGAFLTHLTSERVADADAATHLGVKAGLVRGPDALQAEATQENSQEKEIGA